jgi:hypothetical protein
MCKRDHVKYKCLLPAATVDNSLQPIVSDKAVGTAYPLNLPSQYKTCYPTRHLLIRVNALACFLYFRSRCTQTFRTKKRRGVARLSKERLCSYLLYSLRWYQRRKFSRRQRKNLNYNNYRLCVCISCCKPGKRGLGWENYHLPCTVHCKDKMPKIETLKLKIWNKYYQKRNIGYQSQFPHSCVCERIIYSHDGSAFPAGGNMWTDPGNIYVNRSQTHECGNWGWGRAIPRKGIYKRNCRCSV